jgi:hypothetical protein
VHDERKFSDLTLIMRALMQIGRNVEICRRILEDEYGEVEEHDS